MRQPHYFFWANLVLRTPSDAWAVFQLEGHSYPGLSESRKVEVGERLEALAYTLEADFQILRVARAFNAEAYARRALSTLDPRHAHRERFEAHIAEHRAEFERRGALRPEIYLAVRLGPATAPVPSAACSTAPPRPGVPSPRCSASRSRAASAPAQLAALRQAEEAAFERVLSYLECRRVGPRAPRGADPPRLHPRSR